MSSDIRDVLSASSREPVSPLDLVAIRRRAGRIRAYEILTSALAVVIVVSGAVAGWQTLSAEGPRPISPGSDAACDRQKIESMTLYLMDSATDEEVDRLLQDLSESPDVTAVFFSKAEAYEEFKETYRDQPEFWENLPRNALPASIRVELGDEADPDDVTARAQAHPIVDEIRRHRADDDGCSSRT